MAVELDSVLVTGANRGIGLELVRQLVNLNKPPRYVFATYRNKSTVGALELIGNSSKRSRLILIQMDVTKDEDLEAARKVVEGSVGEEGLNLLINNAGVLKKAAFPEITEEYLLLHFKCNTIGPIQVLKTFLPLLQKAAASKSDEEMSISKAAAVNISAGAGSIEMVSEAIPKEWMSPTIGYRVSKVALNMAMRVISLQMKDQGVLIVNMCPGWVKTDMTSGTGPLQVEESISSMLDTFSRLDSSNHGCFIDRNGGKIPF